MPFLITIFISSFLLFQVQPIIAKMALPYFGGGAAIWTACMLFFQLFLLLGYLYAHTLSKIKKVNQQITIHSGFILLSLVAMPIGQLNSEHLLTSQTPQINIITSLFMAIGFPYFLLSTTAPLIQKWYSLNPNNNQPYRLYALSNLGSLLALLSYPFVIEPNLDTTLQSTIWGYGYYLFMISILFCSFRLFKFNYLLENQKNDKAPTDFKCVCLWLGLSACSVILMMATTSAMTINIPPTPFLWILPLCIYLLTYIICFNSPKWYIQKFWFTCFACSSFAGTFLFFVGIQFSLLQQVFTYSILLLSACMICHGELAKLQPHKNKLTFFYLILALGGVLGSLFTAIVAEKIFTQYYELIVGIGFIYLLFSLSLYWQNQSPELSKIKKANNKFLCIASSISFVTFGFYFNQLDSRYFTSDVHNSRNFYGVLAVKDQTLNDSPIRVLFDGATNHGSQSLIEAHKSQPTSYYRANSGVALALNNLDKMQSNKVGIVGLGTGTLASYAQPQDHYVFYELNPAVATVARQHFSYLSDSKAKTDIRVGDARITMQNELKNTGSQQYDALVIDAFSSDTIPVHLLTLDAFELYLKHLKKEGLLALHISNNHLDLLPLINALAVKLNIPLNHFIAASSSSAEQTTQWVVLTHNKDFINNGMVKIRATYLNLKPEETQIWTDKYSNLLSVIKF